MTWVDTLAPRNTTDRFDLNAWGTGDPSGLWSDRCDPFSTDNRFWFREYVYDYAQQIGTGIFHPAYNLPSGLTTHSISLAAANDVGRAAVHGPDWDTLWVRTHRGYGLGALSLGITPSVDSSKVVLSASTWDGSRFVDSVLSPSIVYASNGWVGFRVSAGLLRIPCDYADAEETLAMASLKLTLSNGWISGANGAAIDNAWGNLVRAGASGAPALSACLMYRWGGSAGLGGYHVWVWFDRPIKFLTASLTGLTVGGAQVTHAEIPACAPNLLKVRKPWPSMLSVPTVMNIPAGLIGSAVDGVEYPGGTSLSIARPQGIQLIPAPVPPHATEQDSSDIYGSSLLRVVPSGEETYGGCKPTIWKPASESEYRVVYKITSATGYTKTLPDDEAGWDLHLAGMPTEIGENVSITGWNNYEERFLAWPVKIAEIAAVGTPPYQAASLYFGGYTSAQFVAPNSNAVSEAKVYDHANRRLLTLAFDNDAITTNVLGQVGLIWGSGGPALSAGQRNVLTTMDDTINPDVFTDLGLSSGALITVWLASAIPSCFTPSGRYPIRFSGNIYSTSVGFSYQPTFDATPFGVWFAPGMDNVVITVSVLGYELNFGTDPYSQDTTCDVDLYSMPPSAWSDWQISGTSISAPTGASLLDNQLISLEYTDIVWNSTSDWDSGTTYSPGDPVRFYDPVALEWHRYIAGAATTVGLDPVVDSGNWTTDDAGDPFGCSCDLSRTTVAYDTPDPSEHLYYLGLITPSADIMIGDAGTGPGAVGGSMAYDRRYFPAPWSVTGAGDLHRPGRVAPGEGGGYY